MNTQESVEASKLLRGVYLSIVRPPNLSPTESRDVWREGHSIDAINVQIGERRSSVRKDQSHSRESGRIVDCTVEGACESERAKHTQPLLTMAQRCPIAMSESNRKAIE